MAAATTAKFDQYAPEVCKERQRRIRVALAAWAYERYDDSIMSDAEFDKLCLQIQPQMKTGHGKCDRFFATEFDPSTGSWVFQHPELDRLDWLLRKVWPNIGAASK